MIPVDEPIPTDEACYQYDSDSGDNPLASSSPRYGHTTEDPQFCNDHEDQYVK